jgi:signal transduction histidine kinase
MNLQADTNRTLDDLAVLYELALAAGESLQLSENCGRFLSVLLRRKGLSYAGVWLRMDRMPGAVGTDGSDLAHIYGVPSERALIERVPASVRLLARAAGDGAIGVHAGEPDYAAAPFWDGAAAGSGAALTLGSLGFLILHVAGPCDRFDSAELTQLATVARKFALTIEASLAHEQAVDEIAERRRLEQEQKEMREQLQQALKMEAVGRLAGGIAHDFNNILTVIAGYSSLLLDRSELAPDIREEIQVVQDAAERGANVTRQLLAFSRHQVLAPRVARANPLVSRIEDLLRHVLGTDVQLISIRGPAVGSVKVDVGQIEQVLMNLAINARDAMPHGGTLTIETAEVDLDDGFVAHNPGSRLGRHVLISVADTGTGMTPEVRARAFEPFFTTKEAGRGTGLGLASAYGIVKQSDGYITLESTPGVGTTLRIYLPHHADTSDEAPSAAPRIDATTTGQETILVVEDDDLLGNLIQAMLRDGGYTALVARHAGEALVIAEQHAGPIALLLTDIVMPHIQGPELAQRITAVRPETRVLYITGQASGEARECPCDESRILRKPFSIAALRGKVREILDAG